MQKYYDQIIENAKSIILRWSPDLKILFLNPYGREFFGCAPEEDLIGKDLMKVFIPKQDSYGRNLKKMLHAIVKYPEKFEANENECRTKTGEMKWVSWTNCPLYDAQGNVQEIVSIGNDTTQVRSLMAAYEESEKRFRDMSLSMVDWAWETDTKGRYTFVAGRAAEHLGYRTEEVLGKSPFDFMEPKQAKKVKKIFKEKVKAQEPIIDLENWIIDKNGESRCFLTNGVPRYDCKGRFVGYRGTDKEITLRKKNELRLQESEKKFEELTNNLQQCVWIKSCGLEQPGEFFFVNPSFEKIFGHPVSYFEKNPQAFLRMVHPDDRARVRSLRCTEGFSKPYNIEYRIQRSDGEILWIWSRGIVLNDEMVPPKMVGIVDDITYRKLAELEHLRVIEMFKQEQNDLKGA